MGSIMELLNRLITEHGSAEVRGEIIALLREQIQILEKQKEQAEHRASDLVKQLEQCQSALAAQARREEFVECRGALFKRKPDVGYHRAVYCPRCHTSTATGPLPELPFHCHCGWMGTFTAAELDAVMADLPR